MLRYLWNRQEAEGTRTDTRRQLQCKPINTLHAHNCPVISGAQAQQSFRSEALLPQLIRDLDPRFLLAEPYFPFLPVLLPSHHPSHSQPQKRLRSHIFTPALGCPQATDLPNERSTVETSSRMNSREEQAHLAQTLLTRPVEWEGCLSGPSFSCIRPPCFMTFPHSIQQPHCRSETRKRSSYTLN